MLLVCFCAEPSVVVIVVVVDGLAPPVIEAEVGANDCDMAICLNDSMGSGKAN